MSIYDILNTLARLWQATAGDRKGQNIILRAYRDLARHWRIR